MKLPLLSAVVPLLLLAACTGSNDSPPPVSGGGDDGGVTSDASANDSASPDAAKSSEGGALDGALDGAGDDGGNAACPANAVASLPALTSIDAMAGIAFDSSGIVFAAIPDVRQSGASSDGPNLLVTMDVTANGTSVTVGAPKTIFTAGSPGFIGRVMLVGSTVYFDVTIGDSKGTPEALYSIPRAGGAAPTALFTPSTGQKMVDFTTDGTKIYLVTGDDFSTDEQYHVATMPLAGGAAPTTVYTAPDKQQIDRIELEGTTLAWTEEAEILTPSTPTSIRTMNTTLLTPSLFATVPDSVSVSDFVVPAKLDQIFFSAASAGVSDGGVQLVSGVYGVKQNASPVLVDAAGELPIVEIEGFGFDATDVLFVSPPGVRGFEYGYGSGAPSTVLSNGVGVDAIVPRVLPAAGDAGATTILYSLDSCMYETAWAPQ